MANLIIFIRAIPKASGGYALELTDSNANHGVDHLNSKTKPGAKVKWKLAKFSGIKIEKILNIATKDGSFNVFAAGPSPTLKGNWTGIVGKDMEGKIEQYFIEYQIDGQTYICDPDIEIQPPEK